MATVNSASGWKSTAADSAPPPRRPRGSPMAEAPNQREPSVLAVHSGALGDVILFGRLLSRLGGGCTLVTGGEFATGGDLDKGWFYKPTIFDNVTPEMRIAQEEIFGPVLSVLTVDSFEEAIEVLNNTPFGLSSSIYTNDVNRAFAAMRDFEVGLCYINAPTIGAESHTPFGGWKNTGNGHREGAHTIYDIFTEWKTVVVDHSGALQKAQIDEVTLK